MYMMIYQNHKIYNKIVILVNFFDKLLRNSNMAWKYLYEERIFTYRISETMKWLSMFTEFKIYHEKKLCKPMFAKPKYAAKLLA